MTSKNSSGDAAKPFDAAKLLADQIKQWTKERDRLNDLIAFARGDAAKDSSAGSGDLATIVAGNEEAYARKLLGSAYARPDELQRSLSQPVEVKGAEAAPRDICATCTGGCADGEDCASAPAPAGTLAAHEATLRDWLTIIHDNGLSTGDRLQRISVMISAILRGDAPGKYPPHQIREQCSCGFKEAIADAAGTSKVLDTARLDWLSEAVENGCVTSCFEVDGGVHLTLDEVGEDRTSYRNQDNLRAAIDAARAKNNGGDA
jgi:hypothetical protein